LHPHPYRPPTPFFAPSGFVSLSLDRQSKGGCIGCIGCLQCCRLVVAQAPALGYDIGVVLALQFSAYGEARKCPAVAGGAWVVPVFCAAAFRGHTHTYMIQTCRRAWALTVCCWFFFIFKCQKLDAKSNANLPQVV